MSARLQMNPATSQMQRLAERIVVHESRANKSTGTKSPATFPVCEKLRAPLSVLVGSTGFSALLSRALALASRDVPWLRAVHVKTDGSLDGTADLETEMSPQKGTEGQVALLARLLGLLWDFIGESLTMQLMREVWPKLSLGDASLIRGDENESRD